MLWRRGLIVAALLMVAACVPPPDGAAGITAPTPNERLREDMGRQDLDRPTEAIRRELDSRRR